MPDNYDEYEEDPRETSTIRDLRAQIKEREAQLKDYDTLKQQAARAGELERENAFFKADLPRELNDTQRKAIFAISDAADPDGFRKAAEELGFIKAPEPAVPVEELAAMDRIAGGGGAGANLPDAANYDAEINAAQSPEQVLAVMAKYGRNELVE